MMKYQKDIRELCKKLKPVIGEKADILWNMYLAEDERGRRDLALEIEIIAEKVLNKRPLENEKITGQDRIGTIHKPCENASPTGS